VLSVAKAAIVTSGTATLETALFNVPQVVVYKTNPVSYLLAKFVIRVPFISLVNLVAGKEVVKELIQKEVNSTRLSDELKLIIANEENRERILAEYKEVYTTLDAGGSASANAAALMIKYLNEKN
jgi:lipid-A-disaccharide synthase